MKLCSKLFNALLPSMFLLLLLSSSIESHAKGGPFGLGVLLGSPSAISGKVFFDRNHAIDFGVGWGWLGSHSMNIHMDYLAHVNILRTRAFRLKFFIGFGGIMILWFNEDVHHWDDRDGRLGLALRVPIGFAFHLRKIPIDPFFEVAPGIGLFPGVGPIVEGGIGVRYYF